MKLKRSTVLPVILTVYLAVMAGIGYPEYAAGRTSPLMYFGIIAITLAVIVLLHFNLKRRERYRRERLDDIRRNEENSSKTK